MSNRLSREKINYLSRQVLAVLEKDDQVDFLDDPNEVRLIIVKSIEEEMRLYEAIDQIVVNAFGTVRQRIARHLLDAAIPGKQGHPVVAVTQQDLANAVGSAREVVARFQQRYKRRRRQGFR